MGEAGAHRSVLEAAICAKMRKEEWAHFIMTNGTDMKVDKAKHKVDPCLITTSKAEQKGGEISNDTVQPQTRATQVWSKRRGSSNYQK
jgi:hypothetical protein